MKTLVHTLAPTVTAPQLRHVVDALWALAENPSDRRAKIKLALLDQQGALACPCCGIRFDVAGSRGTHTSFSHRRALDCLGCRTTFVVEDQATS